MADNRQKCEHAACNCMAEPGSKYCSARCEEMAGQTVTKCACGHAGCAVGTSKGAMPAAGL